MGVEGLHARFFPVAEGVEPLELAFWQSVEASDDPEEYRAYLEQFPEGAFATLAEARLTSPSEQSSSTDRTVELEFWNSIKDTKVPANFEAYLEKYPDGEFRAWPRSGWQIFRTHPWRPTQTGMICGDRVVGQFEI